MLRVGRMITEIGTKIPLTMMMRKKMRRTVRNRKEEKSRRGQRERVWEGGVRRGRRIEEG